jgi:YD repeat-containing protein
MKVAYPCPPPSADAIPPSPRHTGFPFPLKEIGRETRQDWAPPGKVSGSVTSGASIYDKAGNRTSEQIDWGVTKANYNDLTQLTDTAGGGPVRFAGRLSEPGTVQVAGSPAVMGIQNTSFVAHAQTTLGTNIVNLSATDYSTNTATTNYLIVVTNNGVTRTLAYDLNGNLTNMATAISTNTYEWDAVNRLTKITQLSTLKPQLTSEFTYDGLGRRVRIVEKTKLCSDTLNNHAKPYL